MILNADALASLLSLTAMEIVLGVDNIVFIAILVSRLPREKQAFARSLGLGLALVSRLGLLLSIAWVMSLTTPVFEVLGHPVSGRDLILGIGGLFLIAKATKEIHDKLEGEEDAEDSVPGSPSMRGKFFQILVQILLLDVVFSLDSVITAVGMAQEIWIMVTAMVAAVIVMLIFAGKIGDFVLKHPTVKILALSFLLLIGVTLLMEGMGNHVSKAYIYFAMGFSLAVEALNMRYRAKHKGVKLRY